MSAIKEHYVSNKRNICAKCTVTLNWGDAGVTWDQLSCIHNEEQISVNVVFCMGCAYEFVGALSRDITTLLDDHTSLRVSSKEAWDKYTGSIHKLSHKLAEPLLDVRLTYNPKAPK